MSRRQSTLSKLSSYAEQISSLSAYEADKEDSETDKEQAEEFVYPSKVMSQCMSVRERNFIGNHQRSSDDETEVATTKKVTRRRKHSTRVDVSINSFCVQEKDVREKHFVVSETVCEDQSDVTRPVSSAQTHQPSANCFPEQSLSSVCTSDQPSSARETPILALNQPSMDISNKQFSTKSSLEQHRSSVCISDWSLSARASSPLEQHRSSVCGFNQPSGARVSPVQPHSSILTLPPIDRHLLSVNQRNASYTNRPKSSCDNLHDDIPAYHRRVSEVTISTTITEFQTQRLVKSKSPTENPTKRTVKLPPLKPAHSLATGMNTATPKKVADNERFLSPQDPIETNSTLLAGRKSRSKESNVLSPPDATSSGLLVRKKSSTKEVSIQHITVEQDGRRSVSPRPIARIKWEESIASTTECITHKPARLVPTAQDTSKRVQKSIFYAKTRSDTRKPSKLSHGVKK